MEPPLMTPAQVAEWLGVSIETVRDREYREKIGLRTLRIGGQLRFRQADVELLAEEGPRELDDEPPF